VAEQCEILMIEDPGATAASQLGHRLRGLGFRDTLVQHPRELAELMEQTPLPFRAALLTTRLPRERLAALLAPLRAPIAAGQLTGLAVGDTPGRETRELLREAGFALALWHPFDDRTLRFQVNRAFIRSREGGPARGELRAPLSWCVSVHSGGRRKRTDLYSLSERGAFLETQRPSMAGTKIEVKLPLLNGGASLAAQVVHTNVPGNLRRPHLPIGMGIRFEDPSPAVREELTRLIVERSRDLLV
jgi:hypothetical protein